MLHNGQQLWLCADEYVCVRCVCVDHRYAIPGSSCQEELPPRHAVPESKHRLDCRKHVQVTRQHLKLLCKYHTV